MADYGPIIVYLHLNDQATPIWKELCVNTSNLYFNLPLSSTRPRMSETAIYFVFPMASYTKDMPVE